MNDTERMRKSRVMFDLAACLRGQMPAQPDWMRLIALANDSMTTTNLGFALLAGKTSPGLPDDVQVFLLDVMARNTQRNQRLLAQVQEAVSILASAKIAPVLMRGAAFLVTQEPTAIGERLTSDTDLLVEPQEKREAVQALVAHGYAIAEETGDDTAPVTLARETDVGMIDLHVYPRGPRRFAQLEQLRATCRNIPTAGTRYRVPSPEFQIQHLVAHDQFHNRDYWKGNIDIRHLCDLARIVSSEPALDWQHLVATFTKPSDADAFASQLLQAHRLLGLQAPEELLARPMARLQMRRCLAQLDVPLLRLPALALTMLAGPLHQSRDSVDHKLPKLARARRKLRGIWRLMTFKPVGKI